MRLTGNIRRFVNLLGVVCAIIVGNGAPSQQVNELNTQITTEERLSTELWWPTKANLPLSGFAGSASCGACHAEGRITNPSAMRTASKAASEAHFIEIKSPPAFRFPPFVYMITSAPGGVEYSISRGPHKLSRQLGWVMGAGTLAHTFLYEAGGRWYQSEVSYYTKIAALDITTGLHGDPSATLPMALGQPLASSDARACFGCHTVHATSSTGFNPLHAEPGIGCEACHGPGLDHVSRMKSKNTAHQESEFAASPESTSVFDPAKLSPSDSIDFCGSCHRTSADAHLSSGPGLGTAVVRFQPYRLQESKCWRSTKDARLTCVACHDPHEALNRNTASYDGRCLACHSQTAEHSSAKVCPTATTQCVTCHMPKFAIASMHGEFTDHFIRIVHPGDATPR